MEQNNDQSTKPIKIERLQQSIDEIDVKINRLVSKKEALKTELDNAVNYELIAIVTGNKTPTEVLDFIKQARSGGFMVDLVRQKPEQNQNRMEVGNDILGNDKNES